MSDREVESIAAELYQHESPRFLDDDHVDRGNLNCRCGERFRTYNGYRDWTTWRYHVAKSVVKVTRGEA